MFYIIASKIPYVSTMKSNQLLIIFILGSIAYILLHYYLYSRENIEFVENIKGYIYYIMTIDLAVAYFLSIMFKVDTDEDEENRGYSKEQRKEIEKNLQELKNSKVNNTDMYKQKLLELQLEQQKRNKDNILINENTNTNNRKNIQVESTESNEEKKSQQSPFMSREEADESEKNDKAITKTKKDTSTSCSSSIPKPPKKIKKKDRKSQKINNDTDIPVYVG